MQKGQALGKQGFWFINAVIIFIFYYVIGHNYIILYYIKLEILGLINYKGAWL